MLVGVDHIQVSVADLDAAADWLVPLGYEQAFRVPRFTLDGRDYPCFADPAKAMAFFRGRDGAQAVEVISAMPGEAEKACLEPRFRAGGGVDGLIVHADRWADSLAFWTDGLGFREIERGEGASLLRNAATMVSPALEVALIEAETPAHRFATVDEPGAVMLGLIVTDLAADARAAKALAVRVLGEAMPFLVDGRTVTATMIEGPSGELIELLEIGRTAGGRP